jgi:hypothetical protein
MADAPGAIFSPGGGTCPQAWFTRVGRGSTSWPSQTSAAQLGSVLDAAGRVVEAIYKPEQTYVCSWAHGAEARRRLHFAVQPVTAAVVARYGGLQSEQRLVRILASGDKPDAADIGGYHVPCDLEL